MPGADTPETRYAVSGDLRIAYQVIGDGPLDVVYAPGFISHLDLQWADPDWSRCMRRLASFSRLILFDKRGTGLSDPTPVVPTLEERIDDIRAVVDAVGADQFALFGFSEGAAMSLAFAATYPERVTSLVLYGALLWPQESDTQTLRDFAERKMAEMNAVLDRWGEGLLFEFMCPGTRQTEVGRRIIGVLERAAASPAMARALVDSVRELNLSDVLGAVPQPSLLLTRGDDAVVPAFAAREIAGRMPNAEVVELEGTDHWWWVADGDRVMDEVERFLTGAQEHRPVNRILATLLFTDIVDSTRLAASLGDQEWRRLLGQHDAIVREEVGRFHGRIVKSTGDGVFAAFDGPARGIECAATLVRRASELGLQVRAGLHTGECEVIGDDLGGMGVHIAARVSALASPGEVLVSRTVRDLVVGSPLHFESRGIHQLKGVPGEWELLGLAGSDKVRDNDAALSESTRPTLSDRALLSVARRRPALVRRVIRWTRREPLISSDAG
ncbi:MAG: adenylate/guanylate cyclase domain-containing protein [Acidimicrobiia bacterium]|nr:adenylate/guanylate cyclase domain-containing protein [Acidimicrobiia bacterium]